MYKYMWITWEWQRRSVELANALGSSLYILQYDGFFRYLKCIRKTMSLVMKERPAVLFVQNPSLVLAFFSVYFLKPIFSLPIVVDRHSNFLLTPKKRSLLKEYLFNCLSYISIRHADLTIVTNDDLEHVVLILGGNSFVLPDKIPTLCSTYKKKAPGNGKKILVIASFADDEPIQEIWDAFRKEGMESFSVYMSGNSTNWNESKGDKPQNIILTGFLPEKEFINLLFEVDVVIVLTKMEYILLCGCYEAIAAEKPLITSNTTVLRKLFKGAMFVNNDFDSIAEGVQKIFLELPKYKDNSKDMKEELIQKWDERFKNLKYMLNNIRHQ